MMAIAKTILSEVQAVLEHNGIDWRRATSVDLHHDVKGAVTQITVTLLALKPEESEQ